MLQQWTTYSVLFCFVYLVQEQQDQSYAASIQYQPGDKCFVSKIIISTI